MKCEHVYKHMGSEICPKCNMPTHEIDWEKHRELNKEWLKKNPDAWKNTGWWSI